MGKTDDVKVQQRSGAVEPYTYFKKRLERAISRILYPKRGHDHLSGMMVAHHLLQPTRELRTGRPKLYQRYSIVPLFGLAPGGVCHAFRVATKAVSSYLAISTLPRHAGAVYFLWHFPRGHPQFVLRTTLPDGVRTFLSSQGRSDHAPAPVKTVLNQH